MRVQIEPPAFRLDRLGHVLPILRDDWVIDSITKDGVIRLRNLSSDHIAELGKDHVYDYRSDPSRSKHGGRYGFLILKVQVFMQENHLWLRPNSRPGESVTPSSLLHHQVLWTPYLKFDAESGIPPNARMVLIQYRLWSEEHGVPLMIRIAPKPEGTFSQEFSGPSGVAKVMIMEAQVFYISFSHSKVRYQISVIGGEY